MNNDIIKVKYYRMVGSEPDPDVDDYLGEDEVRPDQDISHQIQLQFNSGNHSVYAVCTDRVGNESRIGNIVDFTVQ